MELLFLISGLAVGLGCCIYTIIDHKKVKRINYDREKYNESLEINANYLETKVKEAQAQVNEWIAHADKLKAQDELYIQQNREECERLLQQEKSIENHLNELAQRKQEILEEIGNVSGEKIKAEATNRHLKEEEEALNIRIKNLQTTFAELTNSQRTMLEEGLAAYADALDNSYTNKEQEYDKSVEALNEMIIQQTKEAADAFETLKADYVKQLEETKAELNKIYATYHAAREAMLREEEVKNTRSFYSLEIDKKFTHDITILNSIKDSLSDNRPLLMAMWSAYYLKPSNDLAARVLGSGTKTGIYKITNPDLGLSYIGQARDIKERWRDHLKAGLGIDTPSNNKLYSAMERYGIEAFTFELLEECPVSQLNEKEAYYIDLYDTYNYGFNSNTGVKK